jgi:hypothetical protein
MIITTMGIMAMIIWATVEDVCTIENSSLKEYSNPLTIAGYLFSVYDFDTDILKWLRLGAAEKQWDPMVLLFPYSIII